MQFLSVLSIEHLPSNIPCPGVFDGGYGCANFLAKKTQHHCGILARMRFDCKVFHASSPESLKKRGALKVYGAVFERERTLKEFQKQKKSAKIT